MRPWTKGFGLGFCGSFLLLLIVSGTALYFSWPALFHHIIQKEMPLTPTSTAFEVWSDTSSLPPMYFKIRFFNWTNPEQLRVPGAKPNLQEVGPYVFREVRQKANVTFHPENNTVSYFNRRWWYFEPGLTNGSLNDRITQLNTVAISAKHKVRFWDPALQSTLSFMLSTSSLYTTKTVDELLFKGYSDPLIDIGKMAAIGEDIPPFDKFGWFYARNGSTMFDGHFNMDTGVGDIANFGVLRKWNYKDTTRFFKSPCNQVEGSAGEFWPPYQEKDEIVLFSGDLCRPMVYEYAQTVDHMGVEGYQYVLSEKTLGNNTRRRYPHDQAKYFEPTTTTGDFFDAEPSAEITDAPGTDPDVVNIGNCFCNGKCTPAGLLNVSSCRYGAPVFASLPHFYRADPSLREQVNGINPEEDHDFSITLEPTTGIPLRVAANLQINILLEPSKTVSLFKNVPRLYFPVVWFSLEVDAPEPFVNDLKKLLALPDVCIYTGAVMVIAGLLTVCTFALVYFLHRNRAKSLTDDKNAKSTGGKSELVYLDKGNSNDDGQIKSDRLSPLQNAKSTRDKSELVYLDKGNANDDGHVRSDRRLYPNSIDSLSIDLHSWLQNEK